MEPHPDPNHYAISLMSLDKPDEKVMLDEVLDAPFPAAWMADSRTVLFAVGGDLKRWDTETGERDLLFQWPGGNIRGVSLSPDERYVLLTGHEWVGQGSVSMAIISPLGRKEGVKVTSAFLASWSPAENTVLMIANACTDSHELWLMGPDGDLRSKVDTSTHPDYARWSSDGTRIMYETSYAPPEQWGVTIAKVADGHESIVIRIPVVHQTTWWSPNGRWIAFRPHAAGICEMSPSQMSQILPIP
jgi:Tol biopolymer transport system component